MSYAYICIVSCYNHLMEYEKVLMRNPLMNEGTVRHQLIGSVEQLDNVVKHSYFGGQAMHTLHLL